MDEQYPNNTKKSAEKLLISTCQLIHANYGNLIVKTLMIVIRRNRLIMLDVHTYLKWKRKAMSK